MIWVLCEPEDNDVLGLVAALQRRGENVELVLPEELMVASALTCRIDSAGVSSSLQLHDGRLIGADGPSLVINRLVDLPVVTGVRSPADATYLAEEWRAVTVAWLRTLRCPVLNPPRAASLIGPMMSPPAWRAVARAYGIPVHPWHSDSLSPAVNPVTVVCLGTRCIDPTGSVPPGLAASLAAMSRYVGTPLLGATFDRTNDHWEFVDATPRPQLAPAGEAFVDAIIECAREPEIAR
jgi:hypothetical protein